VSPMAADRRPLTAQRARDVAAGVPDPELPVVTIDELGILRDVRLGEGEGTTSVEVDITPTYSGCPALGAIESDVKSALAAAGADVVEVRVVLAPAWSTDRISPAGRRKLAAAGMVPPAARNAPVDVRLTVRCPRCGSPDTREVSRFGPTPCTSLHSCRSCLEPFEHVKPL
jgi:ring-1,2-phenylacetyl-CoA epoxidase subunit PaaD